jgi:hypothetical protein
MGNPCSKCQREVSLVELRKIYAGRCKNGPYEEVCRILDHRPAMVNFILEGTNIHVFKKEFVVPYSRISVLAVYCKTELDSDSNTLAVMSKALIGLDAQQSDYFFPPEVV